MHGSATTWNRLDNRAQVRDLPAWAESWRLICLLEAIKNKWGVILFAPDTFGRMQ